MHDKRIRIGVVGLGSQGVEHVDAILSMPELQLGGLCDTDKSRIETCRQRLGAHASAAEFTNMEDLFSSGAIDAAVIALPHSLHARAIAAAVQHRVHLLKEKPLARTLKEGHEMASKMRAAGLVLQTGVQRRHHASYEFLRTYLAANVQHSAIASIHMEMLIAARAGSGWRADHESAGGGVLIDLGYHGVDLVQALVGPMTLISCTLWRGSAPSDPAAGETLARIWARAGGAWVCLKFGRTDTKRECLRIELLDTVLEANRSEVSRRDNTGQRTVLFAYAADWRQTQQKQLANFVQAIRGGSCAAEDIDSQLPALRFIDDCYSRWKSEGLIEAAGRIK